MEEIYEQVRLAAEELCETAKLQEGQIMVVGCSSSEIIGGHIGKFSSPEAAAEVVRALHDVLDRRGIYLAAQCCEHLNRAIVIDAAAVPNAECVNVVPQIHAGGSFATAVYASLAHPAVVEEIRADAGLDIGGTLIGMHLKRVAVPVRLSVDHIGKAILLAARTRAKFIGGCRAVYDETKL